MAGGGINHNSLFIIRLVKFWRRLAASKSETFLFCLFVFLAGVALAGFFRLNVFIIFCLILLSALGLVISLSAVARRAKADLFVLFLLLFFFLFGLWRFQISLPDFSDQSKIYHYYGQTVRFYGLIADREQRIGSQKITLQTKTLVNGRQKQPVSGLVLLNVGLWPQLHYGQELAVECLLSRPGKIQDFDYEKYLSRYGIYVLCGFPQVGLADSSPPLTFLEQTKSQLLFFKDKLSRSLALSLSEPQASFFQGFILNERGNISTDWLNKFSLVGLTHIIAISGSHIVVIVAIISTLLIYFGLSRRRAFWGVALIVSAYVIMIGAPASAVRSVIMALTLLYAQKIGRPGDSLNAVVFTAALMTLVNPRILLFDVGFQLSFAAVLGLMFFQPLLRQKFFRQLEFFGLAEMLSMTLAAQIATLPLITFYFQRLSLVALLANALVLPLAPLMLAWGFIHAFFGALFLPLGQLLGVVSWFLGGYFLLVTDLLFRLPLAAVSLPAGWSAVSLVLYLPMVWWYLRSRKNGLKLKV